VDLNTVTSYRVARSRADLALEPGERILAGGTWLYSEPLPEVTGLVDLAGLGWAPLELLPDGGLRIGATCTLAELTALPPQAGWAAQPLFFSCASALLASFKVWNVATVGGNVCRSFAAAGMVALAVALDGVAEVWPSEGSDYRIPVADLVTGNGTNRLAPGDVLRAIDLPAHALRARAGFRKIALAELGRSGAVVTGRRDRDGSAVFGVTAATLAPTVLRYPVLPDAEELRADVLGAPGYYTDPLGAADWRRGVSAVLAEEIRQELTAS
jgi:xanthine dehydrogenase FAD-binding subunit